jgi:transcriptional regulator with XRE-family HTH domain
MRTNMPVALRALRQRRGWRQADLGRRAGFSRDVVQRIESGELAGVTIGAASRVAEAIGAISSVELRWHGADLDRLIDGLHAALVRAIAVRLEHLGWIVYAEVSFNHFGDRGRCDLVAWHPQTSTLLIVEAKTRIGDVQETLGRLDVKQRLAGGIARQLGLRRPANIATALVLTENGANRRVVREFEPLFRRFSARGRGALTWIRHPTQGTSGLLWFESPDAGSSRTARVTSPARHRRAG